MEKPRHRRMSYCSGRIPGMEICELNFRFLPTHFASLESTLNLVLSIIFILNNIITVHVGTNWC